MKKTGVLPFTRRVKEIIQAIPAGKVSTYGAIAAFAGNHRAARQVAWILHSCSAGDGLPWHRVVDARGRIRLSTQGGYELQRDLLAAEGVELGLGGRIDLGRHLWLPDQAP